MINAILFDQYRRLMDETLARCKADGAERVLQLTCVYGKLTGTLARLIPEGLNPQGCCVQAFKQPTAGELP